MSSKMVVSKAFLVGVMATIVISSPTPQHFGIKSGIGRQMNFRLHGNKFAVHNKPQTKCKTYFPSTQTGKKCVSVAAESSKDCRRKIRAIRAKMSQRVAERPEREPERARESHKEPRREPARAGLGARVSRCVSQREQE